MFKDLGAPRNVERCGVFTDGERRRGHALEAAKLTEERA